MTHTLKNVQDDMRIVILRFQIINIDSVGKVYYLQRQDLILHLFGNFMRIQDAWYRHLNFAFLILSTSQFSFPFF